MTADDIMVDDTMANDVMIDSTMQTDIDNAKLTTIEPSAAAQTQPRNTKVKDSKPKPLESKAKPTGPIMKLGLALTMSGVL